MITILWCISLALVIIGFTLFFVRIKKNTSNKIKSIEPGSLLYNIKNGILLEHILPNKGSPFNDKLHNENYSCFIYSDLGKIAIEIAGEDYCDE